MENIKFYRCTLQYKRQQNRTISIFYFSYNLAVHSFKVELLLELERATPRKVLRKIWVPYCVEYPNKRRTWRQKVSFL